MKNITTKEFCREFLACKEGTRFALKYKTMRECYDALLNGEAGGNSCPWTVWTYVRVVDKKETVRFALWCANRVRHLMTDKRSSDALDAVQRWLNGERVDLKGFAAAAYYAACHAAANSDPVSYCAADAADHAADCAATAAAEDAEADAADHAADAANAADHAADAANAATAAAEDAEAERAAQIEHLRELGNPFEEKANSYQSYPAYPAYKKEGAK